MNRPWLRRAPLVVLAGAAGFAINSFAVGTAAPMLGRVVTLPIAILFGPWAGAIAAVIGAGALRNASFAPILIFALLAEAISVGISARRHKSPLVAGGLVWGLVSLVLLVAPQLYAADYLRETIWPIALRVPLNGLVGIALADMVVSLAPANGLLAGE